MALMPVGYSRSEWVDAGTGAVLTLRGASIQHLTYYGSCYEAFERAACVLMDDPHYVIDY